MTNLTKSTDASLCNEIEICRTEDRRLAGKKGRTARAQAATNATRFGEITRELKGRGLC